jgi:hypothetical protein
MVAKYMQTQVQNYFKNNHFPVLGCTAADDHALTCAIIIAASKLKVTDVTGFTPLSKDAEDTSSDEMKVLEEEIDVTKDEQSNGVNRMFPFGPTPTTHQHVVKN